VNSGCQNAEEIKTRLPPLPEEERPPRKWNFVLLCDCIHRAHVPLCSAHVPCALVHREQACSFFSWRHTREQVVFIQIDISTLLCHYLFLGLVLFL